MVTAPVNSNSSLPRYILHAPSLWCLITVLNMNKISPIISETIYKHEQFLGKSCVITIFWHGAKLYFTCISHLCYLIIELNMEKIHQAIIEECMRMAELMGLRHSYILRFLYRRFWEQYCVLSFSVRWKMLLGFNCRNRLLLTGTPIQNSMQEVRFGDSQYFKYFIQFIIETYRYFASKTLMLSQYQIFKINPNRLKHGSNGSTHDFSSGHCSITSCPPCLTLMRSLLTGSLKTQRTMQSDSRALMRVSSLLVTYSIHNSDNTNVFMGYIISAATFVLI